MTKTSPVNALVMAGRANTGVFKEVSSAPNEALIEIGSRTMLDYVLAALTGASSVKRVVVAGTDDVRARLPEGVGHVPSGDDLIANVVRGVEALGSELPVMLVTSDIPLITAEIVDRYVAQCQARPAELYYPAITRHSAEQRFPGVKRTYATLREGTFTGGNIFIVNPRLVTLFAEKARSFFQARKSPAKMARLLGLLFLIKLRLGMLSVAELEVKVSRMFGFKGVVIICEDPEIGVDVDKLSDLELARRVLAG
jgi:GTP:adenosylcobinamide-phosphate guanylyltransferase